MTAIEAPTLSVERMQAQAVQAAALLKALAHPDRLMLLCQLVDGERCVAELGEATGVQQPSLSQQLGILRAEGLVATRRDGKFIFYSLASTGVQVVLNALYAHYCQPPQTTNRKGKRQ
jgi:DNA-binding transcriptional ArsR family regulator